VILHHHRVEDANKVKRLQYDVIDGKQRFSTLLAFFFGPEKAERYGLPQSATRLQPEPSEDGEEHPLKGVTFADLPKEVQDQFSEYTIDVKVVPKDTNEELVFDIYEDINSGADDLTPQQLRRAVYNGEYLQLINELREHANVLAIRRSVSVDTKKESDGEMILRAFAFNEFKPSDKFKSLKLFLNKNASQTNKMLEAAREDSVNSFVSEKRAAFVQVTDIMLEVFGPKEVCREYLPATGKHDSKLNLPLWDALYAAIYEVIHSKKLKKSPAAAFTSNKDAIKKAFEDAFRQGKFDPLKRLTKFHERKELIQDLIMGVIVKKPSAGSQASKRAFVRDEALIQSLFEQQEGKCAICGNGINEESLFDGSLTQLDHIEPWSEGGETEPGNCQLTHAACNQSKGNKPPPRYE
jgi:hypothetical protein